MTSRRTIGLALAAIAFVAVCMLFRIPAP